MKLTSVRTVSKKRAALNRKRLAFVRQVLAEVPFCEARLENCTGRCTGRSTDVHEILTRARGGSIIDRENVVALCRRCHAFITTHPDWSQTNGWMLHHGASKEDIENAKLNRRGGQKSVA